MSLPDPPFEGAETFSPAAVVPRRTPWPWRHLRWLVTGVALIVGFVLGFIGLDRYYEIKPALDRSGLDLLYEDFHLLVFGGAPNPPLPWQLEVARFLLPIAAAYGALAALLTLFRDRARLILLPFLRDHVVVVGLGTKGLTLVRALRAQRMRVVAIESDPTSPALVSARRVGAIVVVGDAADASVLRLAGIARARNVIAIADEATNAEIALLLLDLPRSRRRAPLEYLAHVVDPDLAALLRRNAIATLSRGRVQLDFFNIEDQAARLLLSGFTSAGGRIVIIGLNSIGERLVLRAARYIAANEFEHRVVVIDTNAKTGLKALEARHPWLSSRAAAIDCPPDAPQLVVRGAFPPGAGPATVIVCLEDPNTTLEVALGLRDAAHTHRSTIVAALSRPGALAALIERTGPGRNDESTLRAVSLPDLTCTSELATSGIFEQIARSIHAAYAEKHRHEAERAGDPRLADWDNLAETYRESNRAQARHIPDKLQRIGCGLVPVDDPRGSRFVFSEQEIEDLARLEHERWVAERLEEGWRLGPERDPEQRVSPYLVPYDDLPEEIKEDDREAVREIPTQVRGAGFDIVRLDDREEQR